MPTDVQITWMTGLTGESERQERLARSFVAALSECVLEEWELIAPACMALLCLGFCLFVYCFGVAVYQLMFDPNAVDVASRLDMLSIDPHKWFPRS
jgi:hypothetical protein